MAGRPRKKPDDPNKRMPTQEELQEMALKLAAIDEEVSQKEREQQTLVMDIYQGQMLPWHQKFIENKARFKTIVAGRKARKTTLMVNELMFAAITDPRGLTYAYLAPWRKQAVDNTWDDHVGKVLSLCNKYGIKYKVNLSERSVRFEGGSKFVVDGANNAEALRGKSDWGGVCLDEYGTGAVWKSNVWAEIIRPNLQVHHAWAIFGGTPKGYGNDFYRVAKLGDHENVIDSKPSPTDKDFFTFHATSYDNQYNDPEEIEAAKRQSTVDWFNQEYLALFTRFVGLVYPEFNVNEHVRPVEHQFNSNAEYIFGLDFAVRGFTASIPVILKLDGIFYIPPGAEYKEPAKTASEHIPDIRQKLAQYCDWSRWTGYSDPSGWRRDQQGLRQTGSGVIKEMVWSLADEYLEADFPLTQANNEVAPGINYLRQLFKANRIIIDPSNEMLIEELLQYQWKDQPETQVDVLNEPEQVRKFNDHLCDALRYAIYSKPSTPTEYRPYQPGMPIKFEIKLDEADKNADVFEEIDVPSLYG